MDPAKEPNPIVVEGKIALRKPSQDTENLLCESCEQLLGTTEKYVSSIAVQSDGSFPAASSVQSINQEDPSHGITRCYSSLNADQVTKFGIIVVWRASISTQYKGTKLGSFEPRFRDYLLGKAPRPRQSCVWLEVIQWTSGPHVERAIIVPESQRDGMIHIHIFNLLGLTFRLYVGNTIPTEVSENSISDSGIVALTDGRNLLSSMSSVVKNSVPKGTLANDSIFKR